MTRSPSSAAEEHGPTVEFWEHRYQEGTPRWDLGQPAPTFEHLLRQAALPPGKTVVLGCGRGHDARLFAQHGFEVIGVDYAPSAIAAASQAAADHDLSMQFIQRDMFDLLPEYAQQFDYVIEHTCFCALAPELRDRYVDLAHGVLKPNGRFVGIFFTHGRPGGPPYGSTPEAIRRLFDRHFQIQTLKPAPYSVASRQNEEHLGIFQAK